MSESQVPASNAQRLSEFHAAIGEAAPQRPTVPSAELLRLRRTLIAEEWREAEAEFEALEASLSQARPADLAPLAHELADLLYVAYGTFNQLGIDADAVFAEIHRANLGKASGPRRADGKILKPEGWQPADVRAVVERQIREPEHLEEE